MNYLKGSQQTMQQTDQSRALLEATPAGFMYVRSGGERTVPPHIARTSELLVNVERAALRLIANYPPGHGKSTTISEWLPAWYLIRNPSKRVGLVSYEFDFAAGWGRRVRNLVEEHGGDLRIDQEVNAAHRWEIEEYNGGMVCAGVLGPLTGRRLDLLILDDLLKNAEEALSATHRAKIFDWFQSVALTRLEPGGSIVIVMTRWHPDDLCGRLISDMENGGEQWTVLRFPALAEEDDPLNRKVGEPLWLQRYDSQALEKIKTSMGSHWFATQYQQSPIDREGGMFNETWFEFIPEKDLPPMTSRIRGWDLAATPESKSRSADFTASVLLGVDSQKNFYVLDCTLFRGTPGDVKSRIAYTLQADGRSIQQWFEREPGSSGKFLTDSLISEFAGFPVFFEIPSGSKTQRAMPFSAQCQAGKVKIKQAPWNSAFMEQMSVFPGGKHDDVPDAVSLAFLKITQSVSYENFKNAKIPHAPARPLAKYLPATGGKRLGARIRSLRVKMY